jgi:hypothetical protein
VSAAREAGKRLPPADLTRRLEALNDLSVEALRAEWRRLHRAPAPPCYSRDLLLRGISYRLQEVALGGLSPASQRLLAPSPSTGSGPAPARARAPAPPIRLKPGSTLVRAWHGETHTVLVLEDGFEHQGRRYASLSQIARLVTGAHWSGPRFFGLRQGARLTAPTATAPQIHTTEERSDA